MFGRYGAAPDPPGSERAAVGIAVGTGVEMNAQITPSCGELRFNPNPDRPELPRIRGTQGLHRPKDVATGGERRTSAGAMAIGVLTVGPTADGIEVLHGLTRGFQTQTPDGIARAREGSRGAVQHQDRLVGGGGDGWRRGGEPGGRGQIHLSGRTGHDQQRQQLQRETGPNDHSSQANRRNPMGGFYSLRK